MQLQQDHTPDIFKVERLYIFLMHCHTTVFTILFSQMCWIIKSFEEYGGDQFPILTHMLLLSIVNCKSLIPMQWIVW